MAFEIRIIAVDQDRDPSNPERSYRTSYKKGYIVSYRMVPHPGWGTKEGLPNAVIVRCNDDTVTEAQLKEYIKSWNNNIDYEIVSNNPATGEYQVRVFEQNISVGGSNALTQEKIESYLNRWGGAVDSASQNEVVFTIRLWNMVRSEGFWNQSLDPSWFSLVDYNPTTGVGTVDFDNSVPNYLPMGIVDMVVMRGGSIVTITPPIFRFTIERSDLLEKFKTDTWNKLDQKFCRRQYYFDPIEVDAIVIAGGYAELTKAEIIGFISNKLDE